MVPHFLDETMAVQSENAIWMKRMDHVHFLIKFYFVKKIRNVVALIFLSFFLFYFILFFLLFVLGFFFDFFFFFFFFWFFLFCTFHKHSRIMDEKKKRILVVINYE